ncbi:hypothetical protein FS837_008841 [Tulasnella sp. UAMH 9824]|nr:hypothetical protein FS837_008841 [Tulasnella sp. UAMH 9824]
MSVTPTKQLSEAELANLRADSFLRLYYNAHDSTAQFRKENVPRFYRAQSTCNWNGNALVGPDQIQGFWAGKPLSKHEIQSYDCHPIPGSSSDTRPASLLITVSGIVVHGPMAKGPLQTGTKKMEEAPRVFSQAFVLMPEEPVAPEPKYYIASDTLRFVG